MGGLLQTEFTEDGRNKLAKLVGITHWICILPSFICLLAAMFIQILIEDKIAFIENYNGAVLPGFLVFTGFFGLCGHILCGKVAFSNRRPDKREKWMAFLLPAVIATVVIFLSELISGIMCFVHISDLEEAFNTGIDVAMASYKNDAITKEEMDVLQTTYGCCGSKSYTDWFSVTWIHPDYVNLITSGGKSHLSTGLVNDDVPFSCCSPHVLRPCIHHHVHDNDLHYNYDYRMSTTLHNTGCTTKLMAFYEDSVLAVAGTVILGLSFIQIVLAICFRFLQTSIASAMGNSDQEGLSIGYVFVGPQEVAGLDTTMTSTEADPLIDKTVDTTFSQDDDDAQVSDDFSMDPLYENDPQFTPVDMDTNDDEHIYNEGEVEEYLAFKFANSREKFESISEPDLEYIDEYPPPLKEDPIETNVNQSMTGFPYRSRPTLTKVRSNCGNYMAMNISNSSRTPTYYKASAEVPKRRRKLHKDSPVHKYPFPRPTFERNSPGVSYVGNTAPSFSKEAGRRLPTSPHRHSTAERTRLLETRYRDRSPLRKTSLNKPTRSQYNMTSSVKHHSTPRNIRRSPEIFPPYVPPRTHWTSLQTSPNTMPTEFDKRLSPQKGYSPPHRISPQKNSF